MPGLKLNELLIQIRHTSPSPAPGAVIGGIDGLLENRGQNSSGTLSGNSTADPRTWKYKAVSFESSRGPGGK